MHYYDVLVASTLYHGEDALTYSSPEKLPLRCLVLVPLLRQSVVGVITAASPQPKFATKRILEAYDTPALPKQLLQLAQWLRLFYPAPLGSVTNQILPAVLLPKNVAEVTPLARYQPVSNIELPALTAEQKSVLGRIEAADTYLLHGETGSGKTRVYIELARKALATGRSAIVLTPEIGLTSQLAAGFRTVFGQHVIVVHSQMTPKARGQSWLALSKTSGAGIPLVVIGPRSALFSPLDDIGLIIVDESHEPAYKQEQAPHYHATRVAAKLASLHRATLVLGSATPSINDYYLATEKTQAGPADEPAGQSRPGWCEDAVDAG